MKEAVLDALLQLFAIIANVSEDGVSFKARSIVKTFLRQHLKTNLIKKYLVAFDQYLEMHHPHLFGGGTSASKQTHSDSEKLKRIAVEINHSLMQREKYIVFLRLVEFINEDDVMTEKELSFIKTVADAFNISRKEHDNTKNFVLNAFGEIEKERILVIDNRETTPFPGIRHITEPELDGSIAILHHASSDTFVFRYLGNLNLFLNGQNVIPERIELMDQGSLITGPLIKPVYYSDISRQFHYTEEVPRIRFIAREIEYRFKNSTKGIKRFSLNEESGNLIGIMGGSGAGKSTLLNLLCGKLHPQNGQITINGYDIHREQSKIEGIIGYVPQDDLLMEELTVFRNLYLNARLCLSNYTETEILKRVDKVLADLDLEDIRDLKVGNPLKKYISGGQRKRLNIALELLREPAILFVDEPTSGLSSMGSEKVMLLLKEQALKGRLVIVNIHQPYSDIFKLFDRFLVLDKDGHVIYKGNPIDAITYFKALSDYVDADVGHCFTCGNVMPEEILKMVEAKEVDEYGKLTRERKVAPEEWYNIYIERIESLQSFEPERTELPPIEFKIPGTFAQFRIFSFRNILTKLANKQYLLINFLEAPLLALLIGYFTRYRTGMAESSPYFLRQNVNLPAYMFMAVVVALFMGLMVSAEEIIRDRKILERESFLRLSRISYIHSKILVLFLISAIQTFSFVLVGNSILEIKGMFFAYWGILFTVSCLANMIGLNISSGLNSVVNTYIVIPFIVVPQLLFSGVLIKFDRLNHLVRDPSNVPVIGDLMTSRWAFEAMAVHQFRNNRFNREFFGVDREQNNASYEIELIAVLESKLNDLNFYNQKGTDLAAYSDEFSQIRKEVLRYQVLHLVSAEPEPDMLYPDQFNRQSWEETTAFLEELRPHFQSRRNILTDRKDRISKELVNRWGGEEAFLRMKELNTNERLEDILESSLPLVLEWDGRLIRRYMPIYLEPGSHLGRAHFYAPDKRLGNLDIDTFWFDLGIIWLSSIFYYFALATDLLRRFTDWSESRRLRRNR